MERFDVWDPNYLLMVCAEIGQFVEKDTVDALDNFVEATNLAVSEGARTFTSTLKAS